MAFENPVSSFHASDLAVGAISAAVVKAMVYLKGKNAKKYRHGAEYGSARWGNGKDIAPFIDPVFDNNILFTQTERLTMNGRPKKPKYARNKNVVVIGGGDTGNDCVGTAIRQGCASVTQLEMMPKLPDMRTEDNTWPEWARVCKTDYGQEEAIAVFGHDPRIYQTTVKEFVKDAEGKVCKIITVKLSQETDAETGRKVMKAVEGSEKEIAADLVLIAAGFLGAQGYAAEAFGVEISERGNAATEKGSYQTGTERVFAAGDMRDRKSTPQAQHTAPS